MENPGLWSSSTRRTQACCRSGGGLFLCSLVLECISAVMIDFYAKVAQRSAGLCFRQKLAQKLLNLRKDEAKDNLQKKKKVAAVVC